MSPEAAKRTATMSIAEQYGHLEFPFVLSKSEFDVGYRALHRVAVEATDKEYAAACDNKTGDTDYKFLINSDVMLQNCARRMVEALTLEGVEVELDPAIYRTPESFR